MIFRNISSNTQEIIIIWIHVNETKDKANALLILFFLSEIRIFVVVKNRIIFFLLYRYNVDKTWIYSRIYIYIINTDTFNVFFPKSAEAYSSQIFVPFVVPFILIYCGMLKYSDISKYFYLSLSHPDNETWEYYF